MACVLLGELASSPFLWLGIEGVLGAGRWVTEAGRFLCGHDDQVVGGCLVTHVLLPMLVLLWWAELAEVIGEALLQCTARERAPARWLPSPGVPMATLQAWCRRLARRAIDTRTHLGTLTHRWYPEHGGIQAQGSPVLRALEAIGVAAAAGVRRFGPQQPGLSRRPWPLTP